MDLIFDSQVLRHRARGDLPEPVLASIAGYYHRATTTSRPMSLLIALVMVILLGTLGFRFAIGADPVWLLLVAVIAWAVVVRSQVRRFQYVGVGPVLRRANSEAYTLRKPWAA